MQVTFDIQQQEPSVKGVATMSKKKYHIFENVLHEKGLDKDIVSEVLKSLCQVIKFDPMAPTATPEQTQKMLEYRRKKAEEQCKSIYEVFKKSYYDTHKDVVLEKQRQKRIEKLQTLPTETKPQTT
jgi:hypothetical protein